MYIFFERIESSARAALRRYGHRFAAVDAQFVPWNSVAALLEKLKDHVEQYNLGADLFVKMYPELRDKWIRDHVGLEQSMYPLQVGLRGKFSLNYITFTVASPATAVTADQVSEGVIKSTEIDAMKGRIQTECNSVTEEYLRTYPGDVTAICDKVIEGKLPRWLSARMGEAAHRGTLAGGNYPHLCFVIDMLLELEPDGRFIHGDRPLDESIRLPADRSVEAEV